MAVNEQGNLVPANLGAKPEIVETKTEPTIPNADAALEAIKARVKAANPHLEDPNLPHQLKKPIAQAAPVKPELDIKPDDKAVLSELAKAQANLREAHTKLKDLEAKTGDSEYGAKVKKLWAGTDAEKLSVLGELSGKDPTEALADLVELFYNQDGGTGKAGQPVPPDANKPLLDKLEAMAKTIEELKAAPVKVSQEQAVQGTRAFLKSQVEKLKLDITSRAENIEEAIDKALAKAPDMVKKLGFDPANLAPDQAEKLAAECIKAAEQDFEQLGKRFGKTQPAQKPSLYDKPIPRAAPRLEVQAGDFKPMPTGKGWADYVERVRSAWEGSKT
jgi:hypothetical protein